MAQFITRMDAEAALRQFSADNREGELLYGEEAPDGESVYTTLDVAWVQTVLGVLFGEDK